MALMCESGSSLTLWLRYLLDTFRTRFRYLGDTGSGRSATLHAQPVVYTDLAIAARAFGLSYAASWAIASGIIGKDDGEQWSADLSQADAEGRFVASVTGFRLHGRK